MADTHKFRIDHHGGLVRPAELLAARAQGDADGLRAVEDRLIEDCVRRQRKLGLSVVTDGEFRRTDTRDTASVAGDVAFVAALTRVPVKVNLPAPSWLGGHAERIRAEIEALIAGGVRYVQLTNPHYLTVPDLDEAIALDRIAVEIDDKPEDVRIGLCPAWNAPGDVDGDAAERLFTGVPVDRWILPFLRGNKGEVELLRAVPADRDVCLGIVDPAAPGLESVDAILDRMDAAAALKDLADVAISPSAGFAESGLGADDQWRKLVHVETVARMCWGNEL